MTAHRNPGAGPGTRGRDRSGSPERRWHPAAPRGRNRSNKTAAGDVWARMLRISLLIGSGLGLVTVLAAALVGGASAAGSAAIGATVVVIVFGLSLAALWWASRHHPAVAGLTVLLVYAALVLAGGAVLLMVQTPDWIQPGWIGAATIAELVAWLGGAAFGLRRSRLPVFDV